MEQKQPKEKEPNLKELKQKLQDCEKLKAEYLAGWQRARADFLNYKKGDLQRIGEIVKYADTGLILKLLPILDNFELAEKQLPERLKKDKNIKGLLQIKNQLQDFLKAQGVEEIKALGEEFDPNLHEVVGEVEIEDKKSGLIVEEIQKGYKLKGKIIRPGRVKITK